MKKTALFTCVFLSVLMLSRTAASQISPTSTDAATPPPDPLPEAERGKEEDDGGVSSSPRDGGRPGGGVKEDGDNNEDENLFDELEEEEGVFDDLETHGVFIHGSFENQLTGLWLRSYKDDNDFAIYDSLRLRVDLDVDLPADLQLRSDFVARLFVGETEMKVTDLIPAKTFDRLVASDHGWAMAQDDKYELENELYVDNAYLKIPVSVLLISVGKQPVEQGAGYVWNPTDVFTVKDMFDPTYEKPGVIALRTLISIGDISSLDLMAAPEGVFEEWTAGGRASLRLGPLSMSAASYVTRESRTDMEGSMDAMEEAMAAGEDPENAVLTTDARSVMLGGDIVADIKGVRLWTEGAYNFMEDKDGAPDPWWELVGGIEYFFTSQTHVMGEYYHYGRGPAQDDGAYSFNDWMSLLSMDLKMLGRDFLFESIDHPVADYWTLGLSSFQSITDVSAVIMADVKWEFIQDGELWLLVAGNMGDDEDFLSSSIGQAWLRLRVFF